MRKWNLSQAIASAPMVAGGEKGKRRRKTKNIGPAEGHRRSENTTPIDIVHLTPLRKSLLTGICPCSFWYPVLESLLLLASLRAVATAVNAIGS